jgi:hypothetical protein
MNIDGTVGDKYQLPVKTRPFDFGTDAIERQRVSLGQSLIDADFEYGLQATKWQTYQELRRFPSFFETPGTDFTFSNIVSGGETSSNITIYFANNAASFPPPIGTVLSVQGLSNDAKNANRAEGFFLVTSNVLAAAAYGNTCNYISKGLVSNVANVQTSYSVVRRGGVFTNGAMKIPIAAITNVTSNVTVTTLNAHGLSPGTPITANSSGAAFNGNFFVSNILSANSFNVVTTGTLTTASAATSNIYMNPYSFAVHRPFDGGVLLSPAQPSYGASIVRQSKKVFRYQSGKGLLWSSGTLFCPNNDIASINVSGLTTGSNITVVSSVPNGLPQAGATIAIRGVTTANVNGTYTVSSVVESTTANVVSTAPISTLIPVLGDQPRFIMTNWHGASVRAGCFDDQNGLFWEYDGQTLFVVRRSATFQLSGTVTTAVGSQLLTGSLSTTTGTWVNPNAVSVSIGEASTVVGVASHTLTVGMYIANLTGGTLASLGACWVISTTQFNVTLGFLPATVAASASSGAAGGTFVTPTTRFQDQLKVNDKIVIRGMTHQVTSIQGQGRLTFNPPYRGVANITTATPVQACKIKELRVAQGQFNRDPLDGSGASGFRIDLTKMQMIGLQYTWYGAGFVDFMVRGADGNWVYAHRMRNNNVNDEAYMRSGNLPVRYELVNECQSAVSTLNGDIAAGTTTLVVNEPTTYFPNSGTLMIDNELISYSSKTSNTFTVSGGRASALIYNVNDQFLAFSGQAASQHLSNTAVNLVSLTCTPSLTHWGSALLMDGNFDGDRGYFFNYANTAVSITNSVGATSIAFLIRLCPSVSNGIVGDIGNRDLLNRAQLLLQKLEVTSAQNVNVTGILNPTGLSIDSTRWVNINSSANGSQPSFAQIYTGVAGTAGPGERIFSTIVQQNNQNNLDLSALKEMANSVIGGNQTFPDGPDVLAIVLTNLTATATAPQVNLFWTEAQA